MNNLNRIKEFRLNTGETQKEFVSKFNKFLHDKNVKGITTATFSRWENSINSPTEETWNLLAEFMNTTPIVLKGALGLDEIVEIIQQNYIDETFNNKHHASFLYSSITDYLAGIGAINKNDRYLTKKDANNYSFWKEKFAPIFLHGQPLIWLITTKPVNIDKNTAEFMITEALNLLIKANKESFSSFDSNLTEYRKYLDSQSIPKSVKNRKEDTEQSIKNEKASLVNGEYSPIQEYVQYFTFLYPDEKEREKAVRKYTEKMNNLYNDMRKGKQ